MLRSSIYYFQLHCVYSCQHHKVINTMRTFRDTKRQHPPPPPPPYTKVFPGIMCTHICKWTEFTSCQRTCHHKVTSRNCVLVQWTFLKELIFPLKHRVCPKPYTVETWQRLGLDFSCHSHGASNRQRHDLDVTDGDLELLGRGLWIPKLEVNLRLDIIFLLMDLLDSDLLPWVLHLLTGVLCWLLLQIWELQSDMDLPVGLLL